MIDVLGLGTVTIDSVGTIEQWPGEGTKMPFLDFTVCDGGLVGTALVAVSRLGGRAAFSGKLGFSSSAQHALASFEKEGVDTSFVIREENAEPINAVVITNSVSGERNIFFSRKGVTYPYPEEFVDPQWYQQTSVLLIDYETGKAGIETAKIASQNNVPVVVDIEQEDEYTADLMAASSHVVISEGFAASYTRQKNIHQMLERLKTLPNQVIIITRGQKGCIGLTDDGVFEWPAFQVNVVDTTGCGDVFHGAYALSIARKKSPQEAARFACAAAALSATQVGGRDGIPCQKDVTSFLGTHN